MKPTKIKPSKIHLRRETLVQLTRQQLTNAVGGFTAIHTCYEADAG